MAKAHTTTLSSCMGYFFSTWAVTGQMVYCAGC